MSAFVIGREFGYWLLVGVAVLAAFCLMLAPLPYFQDWLDAKRAKETEGKQRLALSAEQYARLHFQSKNAEHRVAPRIGHVRERKHL